MKKKLFDYFGYSVGCEFYKENGFYVADAEIKVTSEIGLRSLHISGKSPDSYEEAEHHVVDAVKLWIDTRKP